MSKFFFPLFHYFNHSHTHQISLPNFVCWLERHIFDHKVFLVETLALFTLYHGKCWTGRQINFGKRFWLTLFPVSFHVIIIFLCNIFCSFINLLSIVDFWIFRFVSYLFSFFFVCLYLLKRGATQTSNALSNDDNR